MGVKGAMLLFPLNSFSKCLTVLWLLATKVKLRTNTSKAVVGYVYIICIIEAK